MIKALSLLAITAILAFVPNTGQQDKEYKASLTVNEWQILIANPDDVAANARKAVVQKIVSQIQPQVAADTIPKKK